MINSQEKFVEQMKAQIIKSLDDSEILKDITEDLSIDIASIKKHLDIELEKLILDKINEVHSNALINTEASSKVEISPEEIMSTINKAIMSITLESLSDKGLIQSHLNDDGQVLISLTDDGKKVASELKQSENN